MKKILAINIILIFIFACSNNYQNKNVNSKIDSLSPTQNEKKKIKITVHNIKPNGKCDIEFLANIDKLIDQNSITENEISGLFQTISDSCKNNVEFSEYSNEILFKTLENQPKIFIEKLSKLSQSKQKIIINELKTPISDKFELKNIINKIQDTTIKNKFQKILNSKNTEADILNKTKRFLDKIMKENYSAINFNKNTKLKTDYLKIFSSKGLVNTFGFIKSDYKKKKNLYENASLFIIEYNDKKSASNSFIEIINKNDILKKETSHRIENNYLIKNDTIRLIQKYCYGGNMIFKKDRYLIGVVESCMEPKTKKRMNWKEYENLILQEYLGNKQGKFNILNADCADFYYRIEKY